MRAVHLRLCFHGSGQMPRHSEEKGVVCLCRASSSALTPVSIFWLAGAKPAHSRLMFPGIHCKAVCGRSYHRSIGRSLCLSLTSRSIHIAIVMIDLRSSTKEKEQSITPVKGTRIKRWKNGDQLAYDLELITKAEMQHCDIIFP